MTRLVCINNKCKKGHGYLKDETFNLTIGKIYEFKNEIFKNEIDMEFHISMRDDNNKLIFIFIVRNFFETIENHRDKKIKELLS